MSRADDRLIVALDFSSRAEAETLVERLGDQVSFYKIGYQSFYGGDGLNLGKELVAAGKNVFFDLKLLDIENTVEKGVEAIAKTGATFLTVHAYPKTMGAAARAAHGSKLEILAVTVLTSFDDEDLMNAGYDRDIAGIVGLRAHQASLANMGGVVCSAHEAAMVRTLVGDDMSIVTPGIRPAGVKSNDQKRTMSPSEALEAGASHLVVGRPITAAPDPADAAKAVVAEMRNGGVRLA
ncbi:orotidine-5'-phosphate decarboxylase [Mariluticola halotolerans]|uniref:orotidine-5'-phosphate decarboxylase n=1 Tax=Mariluticola halotolerans TaxID=2909283 RepID=UPI0026E2AFB9|nr:orotidine-5'-phosphate decarboxylase [Mariluticola halotolerans]UJQ93483.1 orotidine-5'-phosphate decarboxylase [Mariluticola halotolerans]